MSHPMNHQHDMMNLIVTQAREERARLIGAAALRLEDEHHEFMTYLSGGSARRLAKGDVDRATTLRKIFG